MLNAQLRKLRGKGGEISRRENLIDRPLAIDITAYTRPKKDHLITDLGVLLHRCY